LGAGKDVAFSAQLLSMSSRISNTRGIEMKYRQLSIWPLNNNAPLHKMKNLGLEEVVRNSDKPFSWIVPSDGR
jgi:hypothetical protein